MDAGTAALIGAGVGSVVSLSSQFVNDRLASRRARRNQHRDRLHRVVTDASFSLYAQARRVPPTQDELDDVNPESVAGQDPEMFLVMLPPQEAVAQALLSLQVHFGHEHPLIDSFVKAAELSLEAVGFKERVFRSDDPRKTDWFSEMLTKARAAGKAADEWTTGARAEVDRV